MVKLLKGDSGSEESESVERHKPPPGEQLPRAERADEKSRGAEALTLRTWSRKGPPLGKTPYK